MVDRNALAKNGGKAKPPEQKSFQFIVMATIALFKLVNAKSISV